MAIQIGGGGKASVRPSMNITPLVDVVLVLLIIFMVVTPLLTKQFWVLTPKSDDNAQTPPPSDDGPVVLSIDAKGVLRINSDIVEKANLPEKIRRTLAAKDDKTLFFMAHDEAPYGAAVDAMDLARGSGAFSIAVVTDKGMP